MRLAQTDGLDAARLLEPVLARWDYAPMRRAWLARLSDPATPPVLFGLAAQAAVTAKLADAVPHLRRLVLNPEAPGELRLEAARTLAVLQPSGLEVEARRLAANSSPAHVLDRLVAANLLARHRAPAAAALLLRLAGDQEPAVAVAAGKPLFEFQAAALQPLVPAWIGSADAGLRELAARALVVQGTPAAVASLGQLLDDPHSDVRDLARAALTCFGAQKGLAEAVQRAALDALESGLCGREQAARLAGAIHCVAAAPRLVQLIADDSRQVRVAAAWALRRLALPASAPAIQDRARAETGRLRRQFRRNESLDQAMADLEHLLEALGTLRYEPAIPLLRQYLPPPPSRPDLTRGYNPVWHNGLRAAAAWSLGHLAAAHAEPGVVAELRKLLGEEIGPVGAMAAVSLGRVRARDAVPALRQRLSGERMPLQLVLACAWALEQITGERVPVAATRHETRPISYGEWFLEPLGH
jgi:HEAT repeat protein